MCIRIPLTQGQFTFLDDDDCAWLSQWRWRLNSKGYAIRSYRVHGREIVVCMHRLILNAQPGQYVDHIDQNRLNNVRSNLRLCTQSQNLANRGLHRNNSTGFKEVTFQHGKWHARIQLDERTYHLGFHDDLKTAALVYDFAARLFFGEFARLNLPDQPIPTDIQTLVHYLLGKQELIVTERE